jgi:hypothetical protein
MAVDYKSKMPDIIRSLVNGTAADLIRPVADRLTTEIVAATPERDIYPDDYDEVRTKDSIVREQHSKFGHTILTPLLKAVYIEYGTEDTPRFSMFRSTFDRNAVSMAKELENAFKNHIENL